MSRWFRPDGWSCCWRIATDNVVVCSRSGLQHFSFELVRDDWAVWFELFDIDVMQRTWPGATWRFRLFLIFFFFLFLPIIRVFSCVNIQDLCQPRTGIHLNEICISKFFVAAPAIFISPVDWLGASRWTLIDLPSMDVLLFFFFFFWKNWFWSNLASSDLKKKMNCM